MAGNDSNINVNVRAYDGLTPQLAQMESKLIRFVGAASSALTALKVVGFPVTAVRQFEAQMANVQKTTNFTNNQIKSLGDSLVDLSRKINVSAVDLAAIASAAGQQGLGREGVEGIRQFTESVSRMASVLDITVEDAGKGVGKIANIFKISLRDIEQVSSAFNQVSNNSSATGEQLLDVVRRIGDAAGSINLQESIGLAATGIDLGQTPEIVGTSYAKIFSEMFTQADKFSKLLGMSVKDYVADLSKDGIGTYKKYLTALRSLKPEKQAATIKQLSGGGRIAGLVNKNLQDADNSVLDKNLENARNGFTSGTSSIKEQLTVLGTLDAQITELSNTFQALGIKAGEVFGPTLTAYIAQFKTALSDPAVIHFAEDIGKSFLDIFSAIATGVKWLAELNVNWENFVHVGKVILGLKLATWFMSYLSSVPLLGTALTKLGLDSVKAGEMQQTGSATANTAIQNQIARIKALMAQRTAYLEAVKAQTAAEIAQSKALEAQKKAEAASFVAATKLKAANANVRAAGGVVTAARGAVGATEAGAAARVAAARKALNDRVAVAEAQHQARMVAITTEGEKARNLAKLLGNRTAMKQAAELTTQALAVEEAFQVKSLTSIKAYYTKRVAAATAAGVAEVGASKLAFMQSLGRFDAVASSQGFGILTTQARGAALALNAADRAVVKTTADLTASTAATTAASAGYARLGVALRLAGNAFSLLLGVLGKAFFWLTIIYTALDAFGALDNVSGALQGVTDWLGLTSEARRKDSEATRQATEEQEKYNRKLSEAIEVMQKFIDKRTGLFSDAALQTLKTNLADPDPNVADKGREQLKQMVEGAYADLKKTQSAQGALPDLAENTQKEIDKTLKQIEEGNRQIKALKDQGVSSMTFGPEGALLPQTGADPKEIAALEGEVTRLQEKLQTIGPNAAKAVDTAVAKTQQNLEKLRGFVTDAFTPQSAEAFTKFAPPYLAALAEVDKATAEFNKLAEQANHEEDQTKKAQIEEAAKEAEKILTAANKTKDQVLLDLTTYINELKASGGLSAAVVGSLDALPAYMRSAIPQLQGILRMVQSIANVKPGQGGAFDEKGGSFSAFTGKLAPPPHSATSGEGDGVIKPPGAAAAEAEARALSKARVELARAGLQAEANLQKDAIAQQQAALEYGNSRSLETIKHYYAERLRFAQANSDIEATLKRDEIAALDKELSEATQESSRVRVQAQIVKAQGELDLLGQQRKELIAVNGRELADATREFEDHVKNQSNTLIQFFGATTDTQAFQGALEVAQASYRDFVQKLRTEGKNSPKLLELADQVELQGKFDAVEAALQHIGREAQLTQGQFDLLNGKVAMLQANGTITGVEASKAYAQIRASVVKVMDAEIVRSETQLQNLYDGTKAVEDQSLKYKELALTIEGNKQKVEELRTQANDTAREINTGVSGSIKGLFTDLTHGNGVQEAIDNFALNVVTSVSDVAAQGLTDSIMGAMGGMSGGIGGFFSGLFGGGIGEKGSETNPMVTKPWAGGLGGGGTGAGADGGPGLIEQGLGAVTDGVESLARTVKGGLGTTADDITTALSGGWDTLMGFLGPLFTTLIATVAGSGTAQTGATIAQGLTSVAASAAHAGGIAGHFSMSKNGIGVLAPAVAYHTGGLVGLAPDEVSAVLKKGEEVVTADDPRHRDNLGKNKETGGASERAIRVVPVLDPSAIHEAISSSQGEDVIIAVMKRRASTIRQFIK